MQMVLIRLENDVDTDSLGQITQDVVLTFRRYINGPPALSDLTPIQGLVNRLVDVQIVDAKALAAPEKARD